MQLWVFASIVWVSCAMAQGSAPAAKALALAAQPGATIRFEDQLKKSGIGFQQRSSLSPQRYLVETMTGGVAAFDYDNDGLLDLFFTNGAAIPALEKTGPEYYNRLYHNNGDGTFTDVTEKAGVKGLGYSMGVAAADYDNDGFVDLYVTGVNHNQFLRNNGNGTFTDLTEKAGVSGMLGENGKGWSVTAGWFDFDNDGKLDLLVVNYLDYNVKTAALVARNGCRHTVLLTISRACPIFCTGITATALLRMYRSPRTLRSLPAREWG